MFIKRILHVENVAFGCFIASTGAFTYLYGRESLLLKYYVKYMQQKYRNKEPVPVHNILKFRLETVLDDLQVSKYNREFYNLFITKQLDPITCGNTSVRQGVKIGIPEHYQVASIDGIKKVYNTIHGTEIQWSSELGEKLLQSLTLSENAQKFAIANAVRMADNYYHFFHAIFPVIYIISYSMLTQKILERKKPHLRSNLFIISTYVVSGILLAITYLFCENVLYLQYDKVVFEEVLNISQNYILGGIEYYDKVVERNKALRNLVKNGYRYYDEDGDLKSLLNSTGIPSSLKYALAQELLQKYEFNKESMTPPPVNPNPHPIL